MKLNRTIYADRDGIVSQLQVERDQARADAALTSIPRYRREYWKGRAEGLELAISFLRDWAGEDEPEPGHSAASTRTATDEAADCACYLGCPDDRAPGWHVHPGEPCPVHPEAPGDR